MHCPNCNEENVSSAKFCKKCGGKLPCKTTNNVAEFIKLGFHEMTKNIGRKALLSVSILSAVATVGGALYFFGGSDNISENKTPTEIEDSVGTISEKNIPKEAQSFVNEYGDRYSDPVSVYYAEKEYKATVNKYGSIMTDKFIDNFKISTGFISQQSELDFTHYMLPTNAPENQETVVKVFNEYIAKELEIYMNLLAKNPSPEAIKVIDSEFRNYCSETGSEGTSMAFAIDDAEIATLMKTAKSVVIKYGSTANFTVARGEIGSNNTQATNFTEKLSVAEEMESNSKRTRSLQSDANIRINVDLYNGSVRTQKQETFPHTQLSIIRQLNTGSADKPADFTYISIGQR